MKHVEIVSYQGEPRLFYFRRTGAESDFEATLQQNQVANMLQGVVPYIQQGEWFVVDDADDDRVHDVLREKFNEWSAATYMDRCTIQWRKIYFTRHCPHEGCGYVQSSSRFFMLPTKEQINEALREFEFEVEAEVGTGAEENATTGESDTITNAFKLIRAFQRNARHIVSGTGEIDRHQVALYSVAMIDEVLELAREIGWKDWKPAPKMDEVRAELVLREMADVIAFFGTWVDIALEVTGFAEFDLADAYLEKVAVNLDRFAGKVDGYGVNEPTEKAPEKKDELVGVAWRR